ncbi:MAG: autoinducer 2 ABC transporter substrate-binding protein [Oscillospiraceae bacterium]|nr:autoinducer 2 ABC transporter substrate-binding protein [Oscillospiraceae bacterium]
MFSLAACGGGDDTTPAAGDQQPAQNTGDAAKPAENDSKDDGGDAPAPSADSADWEIVVVPKDSSNPWFVRMKVGVDEYQAETGLNVYQKGTDQIDATLQAQLVEDLIAQGVSAICVVPVDIQSIDPVLKKARDNGIVVIAHEGSALENVDYDIEAFSNAGYGQFIMDNLAEAMGEEGLYTTMVADVTNGSHNEWADAGVEYQKTAYPNMTLLEDQPRVESHDNGDTAYNVAKELFKAYPDLKGIMGTSSFDAPGVARAIEELGLVDKAFTSGTGMPADNAALLKSGVIKSLTLWDPAMAGKAMISLATKVLAGETIGDTVDLGVDGYTAMTFREGSTTVLEGQGWITINAENVDSFGF